MEDEDIEDENTPETVVNMMQMENESLGHETSASLSDEDLDEDEEDEDDGDDDSKAIHESCGVKSGRYAKMILPHIGLVILLGVYTVCGAGIFHVIELPHEEEVRSNALRKIKISKDTIVETLWNVSMDADYDEYDWKFIAMQKIQELERVLYDAYQDEYVNLFDIMTNKNGTSARQMWTMPQAIFFSTTVITTIGYGHLVPQTTSGRIFCIVFGLFGIPLLLITIADIGKFLSDLMKYFYRSYRACKSRLQETRRRISQYRQTGKMPRGSFNMRKKGKVGKDEMRLPWIMVMLVLVTYTAVGALLFHFWEGWDYFESFYFCFITMATVGFGDIVPTQQVYMFFTIAYILIGLALTTMCIDLAGTEYIAKIHYFGQKIDAAKGIMGGAVVSGLHAGEHLLKHTGYDFMRTAGGRLVPVGNRHSFVDMPEGMTEKEFLSLRRRGLPSLHQNILFTPISPEVERLLKPHIKIRPEELKETDAYIVENKTFDKPLDRPRRRRRPAGRTKKEIHQRLRPQSHPRKSNAAENLLLIAPFLLKESDL